MKNIPLIDQPFIYIGRDNQSFINGNTYKVVETGQHWNKKLGFVIFMTNEENPETKDIDYATSVSIGYFKSNFWVA